MGRTGIGSDRMFTGGRTFRGTTLVAGGGRDTPWAWPPPAAKRTTR